MASGRTRWLRQPPHAPPHVARCPSALVGHIRHFAAPVGSLGITASGGGVDLAVNSSYVYRCGFLLFICSGSEPTGESVVQLVCQTGGIAVLAHPWALKNPVAVVKNLKAAGLHAIEVYRSDGKLSGLSDLADTYELLKLGGSDYHGRDDKEEPDVGSVDLPVLAVSKFLQVAQPIWRNAIKDIFANFTQRTPHSNGSNGFRRTSSGKDFCNMCVSSPDLEVTDASEVEILLTEFAGIVLSNRGRKPLLEQ